ncbi:MAG: alkaline phosphatase family protein [Actinomycetota bacterium]
MPPQPVVPDYGGPCLSNLLHALTAPDPPPWLPSQARGARAHVLLLLDGLGWKQFMDRKHLMPTLASLEGAPIHSVTPTTTATALTSITTGLPPAEHGLIGYRILVDDEVLNVLRWQLDGQDARTILPPDHMQAVQPFLGMRPPVVTKAEFGRTGFTQAHLRTARLVGWRVPSSIGVEIAGLVDEGEPLVYGYYDAIDKIAHAEGLGSHYEAELTCVDDLVSRLLDRLPDDVALLVTADHGQVHVGDRTRQLPDDLLDLVDVQSGEGRFRWLHARPGAETDLADAATEFAAHEAWVPTRQQVLDERWFGPVPTDALRRLGDVALVPFEPVAYLEPDDSGPFELIGRHGSLTEDEVLVPLLCGRGRR